MVFSTNTVRWRCALPNWTQADLDAFYEERANVGHESVAAAQKRLAVPKAKGRHQHVAGEMNRTERAYSEHLEMRKLAGEVVWWCGGFLKPSR